MCDFSESPYRNDEAAGWLLSPVHRRLDCIPLHETSHIVPIHRDWGLDLFGFSVEIIIIILLLLVIRWTQIKTSHDANRKSRAIISILSKTTIVLFTATIVIVTCARLSHGMRMGGL